MYTSDSFWNTLHMNEYISRGDPLVSIKEWNLQEYLGNASSASSLNLLDNYSLSIGASPTVPAMSIKLLALGELVLQDGV